ncbi:hypothetical protein [Paenibacillus sp. AR247]|uniref:hypothetical protein n=1 Tax=Paenibacillus sp. AR247 TaxID=1631599 RepID=UPI000CF9FA5D|nr:hypothetical protein [Paenibacillus sp. AR247]PQP88531.1 hypothetical protein CPT76_09330 [Paenibacillus sp. AR247]
MPSIKPDKAILSEEQVLREAINNKEAAEIKIFVPTAIKFDDKSHLWTVRFKDGALTDTQKEKKVSKYQINKKLGQMTKLFCSLLTNSLSK